jgi:hypothetical protein
VNTQSTLSAVPTLQSESSLSESENAASVLMTCDVCDLVGGPFPAAEADYLRSIHKRLQHGISTAA